MVNMGKAKAYIHSRVGSIFSQDHADKAVSLIEQGLEEPEPEPPVEPAPEAPVEPSD